MEKKTDFMFLGYIDTGMYTYIYIYIYHGVLYTTMGIRAEEAGGCLQSLWDV